MLTSSSSLAAHMETETPSKKRKKKRGQVSSPISAHHLFAQMLAAYANIQTPFSQSLLLECLQKIHLSIVQPQYTQHSSPHEFLPDALLSLLPLLLNSNYPKIAACSGEIIGAAALCSFEANVRIASDKETINGLVAVLGSHSKQAVMAACNAILDLSTTSIGREQLQESSAVEKLLWEGFAHVALHCWNQNKNQTVHDPINSTPEIPNIMFINLLHVAIRLIGDNDPTFRRACMVAAFSLPSDSGSEHCLFHALDLNQRSIFSYVIDRINTESCFLEAFRTVEASVHGKNDGSLQWMRWLRHLPQGATDEKTDFNNPLEAFEDLVLLHSGHTEEAAATFTHVKTRFCTGIVFEDVCKSFEMLLKKYKKTRKQYTNGMLSLHCTKWKTV